MPKIKRLGLSFNLAKNQHQARGGEATGMQFLTLLFGLLILLVIATDSFAQTTGSATLRGVVKDPTGAVIPNATIVLTSNRTGTERKAQSGSEGLFTLASLDPGTYTLTVEAAGFKKHVQNNVVLSPSETKGLDIRMEVGAATESVTISATAIEEIKTETGERSNTIKAAQIENLSIISRSSIELLRILPGVVAPDASTYQIVSFGDASTYAVNGQRGFNNNISVDGSRVIDIGCNCGSIVSLNNDMVQEVTVQSSNYAAEHGNSAVQIVGTTKSGGRDFHGAAYTYVRHDALAANDRFRNYIKALDPNSLAGQKPVGRFYYPGGNLSGPLILPKKVFGPLGMDSRDKLFFFVGFEYQKQDFSAPPKVNVVPTLKQRQGDFSELLGKNILNQASTVKIPGGFPNAGQPAPNNNLAPYIHPFGKALINLYPLPNFNDPTGRFNYIATPIQFQNRKDLKMRFDYKHSDATTLYVRITRERELVDGAYGIWWGPSTYELPTHNLSTNLGRSVAVGLTKIINPTMTNEFVFSGSKLKLDNDYADPTKVRLSTLGMENLRLPFDQRFGRQSQNAPLSLISWAQGQLWSPGTYPIFAWNDSFSVTDNLSKIAGTHTLKFGALIEQANKRQNFQDASEGELVFNQWSGNSTGNDWGDLLVGRFGEIHHSVKVPIGNFRFYNYEFYAQDSWKLRPNFTLEYGLRLSYMTLNKERKGFDTLFSPSAYQRGAGYYINGDPFRPNGVLSARRGEIPKGAIDNPPLLWAPRLNFAWDVFKNASLVIRGGAGIFYNRVMGNFQYDATLRSPVNGNVSVNITEGTTIPGTNTTFAQLGGLSFNNVHLADPLKLASGGGDIISPDPNSNQVQTTYNMSLSIAKRLWSQTVLEVGYVGTLGRHLAARLPINAVPLGALLKGNVPGDPGSTISFLANPSCDPNKPGDCRIVTQTGVKADLSNPLHRLALDGGAINKFRPFPDMGYIRYNQYTGTSNYHSLQVTLSRQAGKSLQFFGTYTFSKVLGTKAQDYADLDPLDVRGRSYGVLNYDRTHVFNFSYNYLIPDLARGSFKNAFTSGLLNGWQISGITTFSSGTPVTLVFSGQLDAMEIAYFGSDAFAQSSGDVAGAIAPIFTKDPRLGGSKVGERVLDLSAIGIPGLGLTGPTVSPFYFRTPSRSNWDLSLFKNFKMSESKNLQFRVGFFNIFNQAFPKNIDNRNAANSDIYLTLQTECVATTPVNLQITNADGSKTTFTQTFPNGLGGTAQGLCDPSKGFRFTADTQNNFGRILTKRGQRVIELALKFTF
jgi:hypothetical protein